MPVNPGSAGQQPRGGPDAKDQQLDRFRAAPEYDALTTDQGVRVDDTDNALRTGERGATLLEDFHNHEKLTHFDHERVPERVVHARGAEAYGYFEPYESLAEYTVADFLQDPGRHTPVFVRFSTVQGPRGSADTVRDVRGFATKFYTREGNYDLVGNNMPVFFIQDAIKFPDFVHAVKMEPDNEMPTGASAHDTFRDFCSLQPESTHMLMWLMSDRAIPRSFRMMQGFGVRTFRLVNAEGRGTFVKFHWKPKLGTNSLVWDEAQIAAGRDPDFNRRLGGPNFSQIPISRPVCDVNHNHRDGYGQQVIHSGTNYFPNSVGGGCPAHAGANGGAGVFRHYAQRVEGQKIRVRSASFQDHYSQATLFWNSMSVWEKAHIVQAFRFELGKCKTLAVRERMVGNLANVHGDLAALVAEGLGLPAPKPAPGIHTNTSPALSQENLTGSGIRTRKVAVLAADGTEAEQVATVRGKLTDQGAIVEVLAAKGGTVRGTNGASLEVDPALPTMASVLYDALSVPGGKEAIHTLAAEPAAVRFIEETYRHGKPPAVCDEGRQLLAAARVPEEVLAAPGPELGLFVSDGDGAPLELAESFAAAIEKHRFPHRPGLLN